jgi:hypothetical protein
VTDNFNEGEDEQHPPQGAFFLPFMQVNPNDIPQDVQEILHRSEMAREDLIAQIDSLLDRMHPEDIALIKLLFAQSTIDGKKYATWVIGLLTGVLKFKHHVCISCGKDHAMEIANEGVAPPDHS